MLYSLLSASAILIAAVKSQGITSTGTTAAPHGHTHAATTGAPVSIQPVDPLPVEPVATQTAVVTPSTPQQQQPASPVTPQQAPATPQYGQQPPYNPYGQQFNPYQQQFGGFMGGIMDPQNLNCEFGQCRNRRITLSPGQGFKLYCKQPFQCDGMDLTLNVGHDPTNWGSGVNEINDLVFEAPQNGATVRINSVYGGNSIEVNNIYCKTMGSCRNLKVIAGWGVELWNIDVKCEMPGSCTGCTINGQSCAMISMMNGNNNGYMPYGYGYTNTANIPGQPQQPQPPQQQPAVPQYQQPQFQPMYNPWI